LDLPQHGEAEVDALKYGVDHDGHQPTPDADETADGALLEQAALEPFKTHAWEALTPSERLSRAWALRSRLLDLQDAHDRKLFPAP